MRCSRSASTRRSRSSPTSRATPSRSARSGALTSAEYRFRSRPFDLVSTPVRRRARRLRLRDPGRPPPRQGDAPPRPATTPRSTRSGSPTRTASRSRYADARRPDHLPAGPRRGRLAPAGVLARGLRGRGPRPARRRRRPRVLTGGRVTAEDAFAYSKFARVALGTNDIDFRARPLSAEEAALPRRRGRARAAPSRTPTSSPPPPSSSPASSPRTRPARSSCGCARRPRTGTRVVSLAPYTSRGLRKMNGQLIADPPRRRGRGARRARRAGRVRRRQDRRDPASASGWPPRPAPSTAAAALAAKTGARLAWVPRRAGDRGALETGCLPNLLPGGRPVADAGRPRRRRHRLGRRLACPSAEGRDADAIVAAARRRRARRPRRSAASTPTTPPTRRPPAPPSTPRGSWSPSSCARPT